MGVKTILFFTLFAHTCTAIFNESSGHSLADIPASDGLSHAKHVPAPSGRSFAVKTGYKAQTDEPIDYIDPTDDDKASINRSETRQGKQKITDVAIFSDITGRHPCNSTDLSAVKCNKTSFVKIYTLSDEAVLFLKGLLVTRVMPSVYILLFLISLPLNALALVTFICKIKAKKPAVIYMSHLACVDLLFTLLLPLKIHYYLNGSHWVFSEVVCRLLTAAYYCYMYCSILLMMCMSVDRLVAVVFPVASLTWRSTRKSMCVCVLVWLLAIAGTAPLLSIQQTFNIKDLGITCHDALIHDNTKDQQYVYLFSILSSLFYFLPLVVTVACYFSILYVLSGKSNHLATTSSISDKRKRAVIMIIAVVTEFVMCFGPTNGILLYHCVILATGGNSGEGNASYMAYMFAVCVGSSSVLLDPLLYYFGSSQCRQKISSLFWWRKTKSTLSNTHSLTKCSHLSCEYSQASLKMN